MNGEPWFIAPRESWRDKEIRLPPDEAHHALNVLRVTPPDVITITDGRGSVAHCAVSRTDGSGLVAEILEQEVRRPLSPEIVVYQGAAKGHKVDDVVQRLAEIGVSQFWVYESRRTVVNWDRQKLDRMGERWRSICRSAAKQSRSPWLMSSGGGLSWTELVRRVAQEPLAVVLWEEATLPLRTAFVGGTDRVALVIGPEGGLEREEAETLADAGAQLVSLGPRILRTENAALVAASGVLYHFGLIG